jgi:hypothetical protein
VLASRLHGFTTWLTPNPLYPGKEIGAVSRGKVTIFFRRRTPPFEPAVHWVFAEDLEGTYNELVSSGATISEPLKQKP